MKLSRLYGILCALLFLFVGGGGFFWFSMEWSAPSEPLAGGNERVELPRDASAVSPVVVAAPGPRTEAVSLPGEEAPPARSPAPDLVALQERFWPDFAYPAILESTDGERTFHRVANHLLVSSADASAHEALQRWAEKETGRVAEEWIPAVYHVRWAETSASAYEEHEAALRTLLARAVIEPDWIVRTTQLPNDPQVGKEQNHFSSIFAAEGWSVRTAAPEIVVAVLDTGIDYTHPDLRNRVRPRPGEQANTGRDDDGNGFIDDTIGWNFVEDDNTPMDFDGHGTHVAGLIGAEGNNGIGGTGMAWDVTLLPVRFLDSTGRGTTANELRALHYARVSGARIVNASYGGPGFSQAIFDEIERLRQAGIWVVASAGNDGENIDNLPTYPASFDLPNVITVGASDASLRRAGFSNFGRQTVDLLAPGSGLQSTQRSGFYGRRSGTSQAAALVSGALALILAEFPEASPEVIRERLVQRTRFLPAAAEATHSGGILNLGHALAAGPGRAPVITQHPTSASVRLFTLNELRVEAISSVETSVQWYLNGEPIPGATDFFHRFEISEPADELRFHARVRDRYGEATSHPAVITLDWGQLRIVQQPRSSLLIPGRELVLSVGVSPSAFASFQWFFDGKPIHGATNSTLRIPSATTANAGTYFVRVSNPSGSVDSVLIDISAQPLGELLWQEVGTVGEDGLDPITRIFMGWGSEGTLFSLDDHLYLLRRHQDGLFKVHLSGALEPMLDPSHGFHHHLFWAHDSTTAYYTRMSDEVGYDSETGQHTPPMLYAFRGEVGTLERLGRLPAYPPNTDKWRDYCRGEGLAFWAEGRLWISDDGRSWEALTDTLSQVREVMRGNGMWLATVSPGTVLRRLDGATSWETVRESGPENPIRARLAFNGSVFAVDNGVSVLTTSDGVTWQQSQEFSSFRLWETPQGIPFFGASRDGESVVSLDGLDWVPGSIFALPPAFAGGLAYRRGDADNLEAARLDGGYLPLAPLMRILPPEEHLQPDETGTWELEVVADRPADLVQLELWDANGLLQLNPPENPRFAISVGAPLAQNFTVRAVYRDGWTAESPNALVLRSGDQITYTGEIPWGATRGFRNDFFFFRAGWDLFVQTREANAPHFLLGLPFRRSTNGMDWEVIGDELPRDSFRNVYVQDEGPVVVGHGSGTFLLVDGSDVSVPRPPLPDPSNTSARSARFLHDGALHQLFATGELHRLQPEGTWTFQGQIRPVRDLQDLRPETFSEQLKVQSNGHLHVLNFQWENLVDTPSQWMTKDFADFHPLPQVDGYVFEDVVPDVDELVYVSLDGHSLAFVDETGRVRGAVMVPERVSRGWWLTLLPGGTFLFRTDTGRYVGSRSGVLWPLKGPFSQDTTFWRSPTLLGAYERAGDFRLFALLDFRIGQVDAPVTHYGPQNTLSARFRLEHHGGLSVGPDVSLAIGAFLESADGGERIALGEQRVSVARLEPGRSRTYQGEWAAPADLPAGLYHLVLRSNADGAIEEVREAPHEMASVAFSYRPHPPLIITRRPVDFGFVEMEDTGLEFPFGSRIRVEARPQEGFQFAGWEDLDEDTEAMAEFFHTRPRNLRARFLPQEVAAAFPGIVPLPGSDWFAQPVSSGRIAVVSRDWSYHEHLGWFYAAGEATTAGAWLWFPDLGWQFRLLEGDFLYDASSATWTYLP